MFIVLRKCIVEVQILVNDEVLNLKIPYFTKLNVNYLTPQFFNKDSDTNAKVEQVLKEILQHCSYTSKNCFYEEITYWQVINVLVENNVIGIDL